MRWWLSIAAGVAATLAGLLAWRQRRPRREDDRPDEPRTRVVVFADLLGFKCLVETPGSVEAIGALTDLLVASTDEQELADHLERRDWRLRLALSDSIMLLGDDVELAAVHMSRLFFRLAFLNSREPSATLSRAGIAIGEVKQLRGLFPETCASNLVGPAVVESVQLEARSRKGPRIFLSEAAAAELRAGPLNWLVADPVPRFAQTNEGEPAELLWLLPAKPDEANGTTIGDVCESARRLLATNSTHRAARHYVGYMELVCRSLLELRQRNAEAARQALAKLDVPATRSLLEALEGDARDYADELDLPRLLDELA